MMNLKTRLQQLQSEAGTVISSPAQGEQRTSPSRLSKQLKDINPARLQGLTTPNALCMSPEKLAAEVGGRLRASGIIIIEDSIKLEGNLGRISLGELVTPVPLLDAPPYTGRLTYIDTETTGLSGGSGTLAFLIGFATLSKHSIHLKQLLLTSFTGEAALLSAFTETLSAEDTLVSYNGKSYDLPLLTSRLKMQSLNYPICHHPHIDLLHPMRRLFKNSWLNCRLATVEQNLLGFTRQDDLPGSEAPEAWFSYIRRQQGKQLIRVVDHNRQDLISLVIAHSILGQAIEKPIEYRVPPYPLARWLAQQDEPGAIELLSQYEPLLCTEGLQYFAWLCRRNKNWDRAVSIWKNLALLGCENSAEHLAKYYEHTLRDYPKAIHYCNQLTASAKTCHRRARIKRRLLASNTPMSLPSLLQRNFP